MKIFDYLLITSNNTGLKLFGYQFFKYLRVYGSVLVLVRPIDIRPTVRQLLECSQELFRAVTLINIQSLIILRFALLMIWYLIPCLFKINFIWNIIFVQFFIQKIDEIDRISEFLSSGHNQEEKAFEKRFCFIKSPRSCLFRPWCSYTARQTLCNFCGDCNKRR